LMLVLSFDFIPEPVYATFCVLCMRNDIVKSYDSPSPDQWRIHFEIAADSCVGVVPVNK